MKNVFRKNVRSMHGTNYARKNDGYIDWRTGTAWDSSRRKSEKDVVTVVDDDDGVSVTSKSVKSTPPPRVISVRDFSSEMWTNARGSGGKGGKDTSSDDDEEEDPQSTIDDIDSGRKMMKDWTPRETLEFIERGATAEDPRDFMDDETIREYEAMKRRIDEAPAKQKRFLLNQALKGRVFSNVQDEEDREREALVKSLKQKVIDVNRTCKVTKGGGLMNFTAMVVVGNGRGVVGFATGKANEVGPAIEKATKKAARSLTFVERFENHTIFHELHGKCGKTRVKMMPSNSGSGRRCNDIIDAICELAGIRDLKAKVHGSHHPHNTVRAVFEALASMQSPGSVAARRGMKVFQV
jgi:small subunit ribosomal protein S5